MFDTYILVKGILALLVKGIVAHVVKGIFTHVLGYVEMLYFCILRCI